MLRGMWEIEVTDQFIAWYDGLDETQGAAVGNAVERLTEDGPTLGRPLVDTLTGGAARQHEGTEAAWRPPARPVRLRPAPPGHLGIRPGSAGNSIGRPFLWPMICMTNTWRR